jgi:hypothetical protein
MTGKAVKLQLLELWQSGRYNGRVPNERPAAMVDAPETAASLQAFADELRLPASESLSFADRYDRLLDHAFRLDGRQLNVKQLRDLAGGGSATTAQDALNRFRRRLLQRHGAHIEFDAQVPPALATALGDVGLKLWLQAQQHARGEFEDERHQCAIAVQNAERDAQALRATMETQVERIADLTERLRRAEARGEQLEHDLAAQKQRAAQMQASLEERLAHAVALADENRQEAGRALAAASEAKAALHGFEQAAVAERAKMTRDFQLALDAARTDAKATEKRLLADLDKATARVDAQAEELTAQGLEHVRATTQLAAELKAAKEAATAAAAREMALAGRVQGLERDLAARDASLAEARHAHQELVGSLRPPQEQGEERHAKPPRAPRK